MSKRKNNNIDDLVNMFNGRRMCRCKIIPYEVTKGVGLSKNAKPLFKPLEPIPYETLLDLKPPLSHLELLKVVFEQIYNEKGELVYWRDFVVN